MKGSAGFGAPFQARGGAKMAHSLTDDLAEECAAPKRPEPTPEQASLGIRPAAVGNGTYRDIMEAVRLRPRLDDAEFEAFQRSIAENRTMRRQLAEERGG
jgi:hypothetical protein